MSNANSSRSAIANLIGQVALAETASFAELIKIAKLNPRRDFKGADLSGVNFGVLDISGYDFTNANLSGCDMSNVTGYANAIFQNASLDDALWPPKGTSASRSAKERRRRKHYDYLTLRASIEQAVEDFVHRVVYPIEDAFSHGDLRFLMHNQADRSAFVLPGPGPHKTRLMRHNLVQPRRLNLRIELPKSITDKSLKRALSIKGRKRRIQLSNGISTAENIVYVVCEASLSEPLPRVSLISEQDEGEGIIKVDEAWISINLLSVKQDSQNEARKQILDASPQGAAGGRLSEAAYKRLNSLLLAPRSDGRLSIDVNRIPS